MLLSKKKQNISIWAVVEKMYKVEIKPQLVISNLQTEQQGH